MSTPIARLSQSISAIALAVSALPFAAIPLQGMETPLLIPGEGTNYAAQISPSQGSVTMFTVEDTRLTRKGSANFFADQELYSKWVIANRNGAPWSLLRTGSDASYGGFWSNKPTGSEVIEMIGKIYPYTKEDQAAELKKPLERMYEMEDTFWQNLPAYDGVVRAALAREHLLIAIPSRHTLMFYRIESESFKAVGWRNYGPELFMPQTLNSEPSVTKLLQTLQAPPARKAEIEKALAACGRLPAGGATPRSDVWVAAMANESFIVVDVPNQRVMAYQIPGKTIELRAVRNLQADLMLPDLIGESYCSTPLERDQVAQLARDPARVALAQRYGITIDRDNLVALAAQVKLPGTGAGPLQATVTNQRILLDFTEQRKLIELDFRGQTSLMLVSVRSYALDAGVAALEALFVSHANAKRVFVSAQQAAARHNPNAAMINLKLALQLDPFLLKDCENAAEFIEVRKHVDWQATMNATIAQIDELKMKQARRLFAVVRSQAERHNIKEALVSLRAALKLAPALAREVESLPEELRQAPEFNDIIAGARKSLDQPKADAPAP